MKITGLKILFILVAIIIVILAILPFYINPIAQRIVEQTEFVNNFGTPLDRI